MDEPDPTGGARRDRTDDLLLAKQALSQLSYGPDLQSKACQVEAREPRRLVGLGRFELPTSRLSSARSIQLSYKPEKSTDRRRVSRCTAIAFAIARAENAPHG